MSTLGGVGGWVGSGSGELSTLGGRWGEWVWAGVSTLGGGEGGHPEGGGLSTLGRGLQVGPVWGAGGGG